MGFGIGDGVSGSLSSPQAIRAGIWPASAWQFQPNGVSGNIVLNAVGSHTGLRSTVVQDTDGAVYFVEYRNLVGDDSTNYIGCDDVFSDPNPQVCTVNGPHVRVLRFEPTGYSGYKGEDTFLIGRNYMSVGYTGAGTYFLPGGSKIEVVSVGASTATVKITRGAAVAGPDDWIALQRSLSYDATVRVGDTLTLMLGDYWQTDPTGFKWYRGGESSPARPVRATR